MDNEDINLVDSDTDYEDSELSILGDSDSDGLDTSDTSDDDAGRWFSGGSISNASSDSSLYESFGEEGEAGGFFELMNQHLEIFNHEADSFFRVSLRTLYDTLMEFMEERVGPTPNHIIQSLPTIKVTLAQLATNTSCPICFVDYEPNEELVKLPCNHLYHKQCILSWLKLKSTCPTCRLDLKKDAPIETIDLTNTEIDNLLGGAENNDENNTNEQADTLQQSDTQTNSNTTRGISISSEDDIENTNTNEASAIVQAHRIFSRSSSPILIVDSSEETDSNASPFSSKVSIVDATRRELNTGARPRLNRGETSRSNEGSQDRLNIASSSSSQTKGNIDSVSRLGNSESDLNRLERSYDQNKPHFSGSSSSSSSRNKLDTGVIPKLNRGENSASIDNRINVGATSSQNKRQTTTHTISEVPKKRKSKETEIW